MAWNDIPARDDGELSFQAYYVRINALRQFLSPLSAQLFEEAWDSMVSDDMRSFRRSAQAGLVIADIIRALALHEVTEVDILVGGWFVHSGTTVYTSWSEGSSRATIPLPGGNRLQGSVWNKCCITETARMNMDGDDDVSLVVGRRTSDTKFDLVAAGYRDPIRRLANSGQRIHETRAGNALNLALQSDLLTKVLPDMRLNAPDFGTLAHAVKDTVGRFSEAVSRQGAWRLLYDPGGKPAHESRHQSLFRLFAHLTFSALRIHVHPNADHGQGPTDITLSLRDDTHVVEFKKDTSRSKILHGLQVQLPHYLDAAGTIFGTYIVMCHRQSVEEVMDVVKGKDSESHVISVFAIDCRAQESASRADFPQTDPNVARDT